MIHNYATHPPSDHKLNSHDTLKASGWGRLSKVSCRTVKSQGDTLETWDFRNPFVFSKKIVPFTLLKLTVDDFDTTPPPNETKN